MLSGERQNRTAFPARNLPIISRPLAPARRSPMSPRKLVGQTEFESATSGLPTRCSHGTMSSRKTLPAPNPLGLQLSYWPIFTAQKSTTTHDAWSANLLCLGFTSGTIQRESLQSVFTRVDAATAFQRDVRRKASAVAIGGVSPFALRHVTVSFSG